MGYKILKITKNTDDLLEQCIAEYRRHHPEMDEIKISRNKILFEIARFYIKV